jgi:hypothetical protein
VAIFILRSLKASLTFMKYLASFCALTGAVFLQCQPKHTNKQPHSAAPLSQIYSIWSMVRHQYQPAALCPMNRYFCSISLKAQELYDIMFSLATHQRAA